MEDGGYTYIKTDTWSLKQAQMPYCQVLLFLGGGGGGGEDAHSGL